MRSTSNRNLSNSWMQPKPPLLKVSETPNFQFGWSNLCLVLRWVALKRRLGGILHAATPLFCKAFGEFVLPARIPPDRLKGDPTPFDKGVFGAANRPRNIYLTIVPAATPCVPLQRGRSLIGCAANSSRNIDLTAVLLRGWLGLRFDSVGFDDLTLWVMNCCFAA